jgi:hypothetical protein
LPLDLLILSGTGASIIGVTPKAVCVATRFDPAILGFSMDAPREDERDGGLDPPPRDAAGNG